MAKVELWVGNNWKSKAFSTCLLVLVWVVGAIRMEEEMTTHSSILALRIPWTEESGGLQSMGVTKHQT